MSSRPHATPTHWSEAGRSGGGQRRPQKGERKLSDFCRFAAGGKVGLTKRDYRTQGFPAFSAAGQDGFVSTAEYDVPGIVVSSIGARCGKAFLATREWTTLANTYVVFPDTNVADPKFLWYQLNDETSWVRSGSAQAFIKPADIQRRKVSLPALSEQRRIVEILDQADRLCRLRAEADAKAERILPALFVRMFGDPAMNPKGWKRGSFFDVFDDITSTCPKIPRRDYGSTGAFPIIDQGKGAAVSGYSDDMESCYRGPDPVIVFGDHTRAVKYAEPPFVAGADGSRVLRARPGLAPAFLAAQLRLHRIPNRGYSRHMRVVKRLSFIVPDLELQRRFCAAFLSLRALRDDQASASSRLEDLARSLHARAFAGELIALGGGTSVGARSKGSGRGDTERPTGSAEWRAE